MLGGKRDEALVEGWREQDPLGDGPDTPQQHRFGADHLCELFFIILYYLSFVQFQFNFAYKKSLLELDLHFIFCCILCCRTIERGGQSLAN